MGQKVLLEAESFAVQEAEAGDDDGVIIEGIAIPFDKRSRNGVKYSSDSIREKAGTMEGNPILWNHDPFVKENVLGHVVDVEIVDEGLAFRASIDPAEEDLVRKVERGDISTVSMQAMVDEIDSEEDENTDADVHIREFLELSFAPIPGFPQAQIQDQDVGPGSPAAGAAGAIAVEEFVGSERSEGRAKEATLDFPDTEDWNFVEEQWEAPDVEDFEDAGFDDPTETFIRVHLVHDVEEPEDAEDVSIPLARPTDDGELESPYEAWNSAHDTVSQVDGLNDDQVEEARNWMEGVREEEFPDREPLDADDEEDINTGGDSADNGEKNMGEEEQPEEGQEQEQDVELVDVMEELQDLRSSIEDLVSALEAGSGEEEEETGSGSEEGTEEGEENASKQYNTPGSAEEGLAELTGAVRESVTGGEH